MIILQTVTDSTNIAMANMLKVACDLSVGIFTFDHGHSKGQGKGHANFNCEYLYKVIAINWEVI